MDLESLYKKYTSEKPSSFQRLQSKLGRAFYAYASVLKGTNQVIGGSSHEYKKLKASLLYLGGFSPLFFKNFMTKKAVQLTRSNKRLVVIPALLGMYSIAIPGGVIGMYLVIQAWGGLRSMYFASYLATLAFLIDDPNHRIYKESKIMRNTL